MMLFNLHKCKLYLVEIMCTKILHFATLTAFGEILSAAAVCTVQCCLLRLGYSRISNYLRPIAPPTCYDANMHAILLIVDCTFSSMHTHKAHKQLSNELYEKKKKKMSKYHASHSRHTHLWDLCVSNSL